MTEALRQVAESLNRKISPKKSSQLPSPRKRRHDPTSDSSDDDRARESNSSGWEDQDSSDDAQLKICEPKKKKVRKKRSSHKSPTRRVPTEVVIPEDVLSECSRLVAMDQRLDAKAKSINWGTKQVKMVLRAIVQSEEMMNMLRNAGLATGEKEPQQQPKMTRAMTKKVVAAGGEVVPFIMAPATPRKAMDKDIERLFTEDLHEEDNAGEDHDYNPEMDKQNLSDDDDSMFTSEQGSELGTPHSINSRMSSLSKATPPSNNSLKPTPDQFKRPFRSCGTDRLLASRILDFDDTDPHPGYSTRSRNPMTDTAIEEIEQMFVPFDITPDMYEVTCDNDDYTEFLKELYGGTIGANVSASNLEDVEDDPEFVYCPDEADKQTKDPEELRNDKATKITKKEVCELMSELLECANKDTDDAVKKKMVKRKKTPLPSDAIYEAIKEHAENAIIKEIAESTNKESCVDDIKYEAPLVISEQEKAEIALQMQQHIQLITQMSLLSSHSSTWKVVRSQCDQMMSQMVSDSLATPNSLTGQSNLLTSLAVIRDWDELGSDPTTITKNKNSKKHKKRNMNFNISTPLYTFMSEQSVFYYPALLPISALSQDESRIVWTPSEDHLLALAMKATVPLAKKPGLMELSFALQAKYMRAKSAVQIRARMKNLKIREEENPVLTFIRSGDTTPVAVEHTWEVVGNGSRTLKELVMAGVRQDFPNIWIKKILDIAIKKNSSRSMLIQISPKKTEQTTSPSITSTTLNSNIQVLTVPKQLLSNPGNQIIIVNSAGFELASLKSSPSGLVNYSTNSVSYPCGEQFNSDQFTPLPRPILCVDGNNATPTSTSDSDTPDTAPLTTSNTVTTTQGVGLGAGCKNIARSLHISSPVPRSPLKRMTLGSHQFHKSPLKAASDRILKKYTSVSPHKRPGHYLSLSPLKRPLRELKKKPLCGSPSQVLTPARRQGLVPLAPKRSDTPPCLDVPLSGLSPRSPCMPSPSQDEGEGGTEADTPTILARRKTRHQKETELTLALVGQLETSEERESREARESQEMFQEISRVLADNTDCQSKFANIMSQAGTAGTISTYQALKSLLLGHTLAQEMLLDLLTDSQAASLDSEVYWQHQQRHNMKKFILKLGIAYRHQPAYHARVLRELDTLCGDPTLTPEMLKSVAVKLFKHNQHLLDQFLLLVPGVEPPEGMLPSPEVLHYPEDSDTSWGSEEGRLETVTVQRSPETSRV
eukprot:GFUD01022971.1.p1 GENE.GFUD01022971.1~~GFUD01022971.1.p1  ORF type:complete len:1221 (-),score=398.09 GFUD01022971.1:72-3734(-)